MEIEVSLSALTPSQYRPFMKMFRPDSTMVQLFQKLSGRTGVKAMRLYFDFKNDKLLKAHSPECPSEIKDYLIEKGFVLEDYVSGTVRDKHDRILRLGKVLSKQPDLAKTFETDPNRKALVSVTRGKKTVCLSMHPYDVAGMSTGRGWTSCMNLVDGINKEYVKSDIKSRTLIAYMIDSSDRDLKRPLSRVLLKRFYSENKRDSFYAVDRVYPSPNPAFTETVQTFVNENINDVLLSPEQLQGIFRLDEDLYDDGTEQIFPALTTMKSDPEVVKNILATHRLDSIPSSNWEFLVRRFKEDLFSLIYTQDRLSQLNELDQTVNYHFVDAIHGILPKDKFDRTMISLCAYMMRSGSSRHLAMIINLALIYRSEAMFKILSGRADLPHLMMAATDKVGIWPPKIEMNEDRYAIVDFIADMIRKGTLPKNENTLSAFSSAAFNLLRSMNIVYMVERLRTYSDIVSDNDLIEKSASFGLDQHVMEAALKSIDPTMNAEVSMTAKIMSAVRSNASDSVKERILAFTGKSDMLQAASTISYNSELYKYLEDGAEVFNFGFTRDLRGNIIFYPTAISSERDFNFSINEAVVDSVIQLMDEAQ